MNAVCSIQRTTGIAKLNIHKRRGDFSPLLFKLLIMDVLDELTKFIRTQPCPNNQKILERIGTLRAGRRSGFVSSTNDSYGPKRVEYGDIICTQMGAASHPGVVISVGRVVQCITVSSKVKAFYTLMPIKNNRFLHGVFTPTIVCMTQEQALKRYVGTYDDFKELNRCVKKLKKYYEKTFINAGKQTKKEKKAPTPYPLRQEKDRGGVQ